MFQLLKYFGGDLEVVGVVLVPAGLVVLLLAVPFIDRRRPRTRVLVPGGRPVRVVPLLLAAAFMAVVLGLTVLAVVSSGAPARVHGPAGAGAGVAAGRLDPGSAGAVSALRHPDSLEEGR